MMCFITVLVRMRPLTRAANGGNVHKLQAQPLPSDCLPTVGMVLAAYYFERELWAPTCPQGKVPVATWPCGHDPKWIQNVLMSAVACHRTCISCVCE